MEIDKFKIRYKTKIIEINTVKKLSNIGKITGLMFKSKKTANLLFEFKKDVRISIHSFFVFFPFLAIWLDKDNAFLEYKLVTSFTPSIIPKNKFRKLLEVPLNNKNMEIISLFVGRKHLNIKS